MDDTSVSLTNAPFARTRAHSDEPFSGSPCAVIILTNGGCVGGRSVSEEVRTRMTVEGTVVLHCGPDTVDLQKPVAGQNLPSCHRLAVHQPAPCEPAIPTQCTMSCPTYSFQCNSALLKGKKMLAFFGQLNAALFAGQLNAALFGVAKS